MKQKHLTLEEREFIEDKLKENWNFTEIGKEINKHRTTISKEILNHRFKKSLFSIILHLLIVFMLILVKMQDLKYAKKHVLILKKSMHFIRFSTLCL